jgi:Zn-dependent protease with chaperone function
MNLEPVVLKTLSRRRAVVRGHQAGILLVLTLGLGALLVLVIVPFSAGSRTFSPLVKAVGMSGLVWAGVIIGAVLGVAGLALYILGRSRDLRFYASFTRRTKEYDRGSLARFLNALDRVASRAGTDAPYLAVLDDAVPNAVAHEAGEGVVIGVTAGALEVGLEPGQVTSMLAHELADVISGDHLRRPGSSRFEGAALALLWLSALIGIVSVPIVRRGNSSLYSFLFAMVIIAFLLLLTLWLRVVRKAGEHDHVLADSIAIRMTGDPAAMADTLERLDKLISGRARSPFPESELGIRHLFMPPRKFSEDSMAFLKRRSEDLGYNMNEAAARRRADAMQEEMDELAQWSEELYAARLENVEEIERGNWRAFS